MNRRRFLQGVALGVAAAPSIAGGIQGTGEKQGPTESVKMFLQCAGRPPRKARRPNIVIALANDLSWPHLGSYGNTLVQTPVIDGLASNGVQFRHAFCSAPTCTASRGALLTGRNFWELEEGANLYGTLPRKFEVYPDLLEDAGYFVGYSKLGWAPGANAPGGRTRNPAGPRYDDFDTFLNQRPRNTPFYFWYGATEPHRPYEVGSGASAGLDPSLASMPPFLPDAPEVRGDFLDYLLKVEHFDVKVSLLVNALENIGELDNTLLVVTSDNGMPFPRGKGTLYDYGTRMPMIVHWPHGLLGDRVVDDFVSLIDLAPTFLEAAEVEVPAVMRGRSLMNVLSSEIAGQVDPTRDRAFFGRERHSYTVDRPYGYPSRAIRTQDFLYIRNFAPGRFPVGDPPAYRDTDNSPTKTFMRIHQGDPEVIAIFEAAFGLRPEEELYDLRTDPDQMTNVAQELIYAEDRDHMRLELDRYLVATEDPRILSDSPPFDGYPYYGRI